MQRVFGVPFGVVVLRVVLIQDPLGDVAVHVIQTPRIRFQLTDFLITVIAVVKEPTVIFQVIHVVA